MSSVKDSEPTYISINSLNTNENDDALHQLLDDVDELTDDDDANLICETNLNADKYRLCKAKAAHDAVQGKTDASFAKKTLTATEAPHLDIKALISKLDDVARTIDLDGSTILAH